MFIKQCEKGDCLILKPEPDNPYDKNAIAVLTEDNYQIGYLSKSDARDYIKHIKKYRCRKCYIDWIGGKTSKGVTIIIEFAERFPELEGKLLELLKGGYLSMKQIQEKLNNPAIISVVYSMYDAGELKRVGEGRKGNPYLWGI